MEKRESALDTRLDTVIRSWWTSPQRSVIFDFNGTLSDDEPILLRLFTDMFATHLSWTLTPADYFSRLAGLSDREIIDTVLVDLGAKDDQLAQQLLAERRTRYCELVEQRSPILPAAAALVQALTARGVPLAIVTGAQRIDVEFVLARSAVGGAFAVIVTEEDVAQGKPDPEGFLLAQQLMDVDPHACLVFEDSLHGLAAARAAGTRTIGLVGTRTAEQLAHAADAVVAHLSPSLLSVLD